MGVLSTFPNEWFYLRAASLTIRVNPYQTMEKKIIFFCCNCEQKVKSIWYLSKKHYYFFFVIFDQLKKKDETFDFWRFKNKIFIVMFYYFFSGHWSTTLHISIFLCFKWHSLCLIYFFRCSFTILVIMAAMHLKFSTRYSPWIFSNQQ